MRLRAGRWLRRYLPAELLSVAAALIGASIAYSVTGNAALVAVATAWSETGIYYGTMLAREIATDRGLTRLYGPVEVLRTLRNLGLEFGLAEAVDTLALRPGLVFVSMQLVPDLSIAVLLGKLAADVVFYVPAITAYELRRRQVG